MDTTEVKAHIQAKQFNKFYIFTGPEWMVQKLYIRQIAKVAGKELKYVDSINDIFGKLRGGALIARSYVYVLRDDKDLLTNEKLQVQLESAIGNNILVLQLTNPDKRTKFYKAYKTTICEFEPLKPQIMRKYIQKEIPLTDSNADLLAQVCENDYGRCLLEIDKIKHCYFDKYAPDNIFRHLLEEGVIYQPPKDAIFDFVDAILDGKELKAFDLYEQCVAVGEAVMVMLTVLYNNAKAVLQVQSCGNSDIAKSTGLTPYQVMAAKKHCGVYSNGGLVHIMETCQKCQQAIVTGTMDEEYVMDYILTEVL